MSIQLSRRSFLGGFLGAAALPLAIAAKAGPLASASAADIIASAPPFSPMWAAGTPGEFNWHAFRAETAEDAFSQWCDQSSFTAGKRPLFSPDAVFRMPSWDGKAPDQVRPADWIDGGLGHCCARCDCEVMADSASVVDGDVVCDECLIYSERLDQDEENGMESLIELICHKGEDGARSYLVQHDDFDLIGEQRWSEAAIKAARWAA